MAEQIVYLVVSNDLDAWDPSVHATRESAEKLIMETVEKDGDADDWKKLSEDEWMRGDMISVWIKEMKVMP